MNQNVSTSLSGHIAVVTLNRPPHNFADVNVLRQLADSLAALDADENCRAVVLVAEGKAFCAGADFSNVLEGGDALDSKAFYAQAMRLFRTTKPIVAAIHGPAIGAGAGLALIADFRIAGPESRFSMSFNRLGFHPGFGLSYTLPRLIGEQKAALLFYTGRRVKGEEALAMGLVDELVPTADVRSRAIELAEEIAASGPSAVQSTRAALRGKMADEVQAANQHELAVQQVQFQSADFREGVAAMAERRLPKFTGK